MKTINEDLLEDTPALLLSLAVFVVILISMITVVLLLATRFKNEIDSPISSPTEISYIEEEPMWTYLIQALIIVESEGNPLAVGKTNDVGLLQITPIFVREVNRILGDSVYSLSDRTCIEKSLEMFEVYQAHHNPSKDILRAIKVHNPRAGQWYTDEVMNTLNKITS